RRDLETAREETAQAKAAREANEQKTKADRDALQEIREALDRLTKDRDAAVQSRDEISRRLMDAEKRLAERGQELGRAAKAVRAQEARISELEKQLADLQ